MLVFLLPAFLLSPAVSLNRSCSRVKTQSDKAPLSSWLAPSCLSQRSSSSVIVCSKVSGDLCVSVCFCAAKRPPTPRLKNNKYTNARWLAQKLLLTCERGHVAQPCERRVPTVSDCTARHVISPAVTQSNFFGLLIIQQSAKSRPSPWRQQQGFSPSSFLTAQLPSILSPFIPSFFF